MTWTSVPIPPVSHPGAVRPDRTRRIDADGIGIQVYEWGDPDAPPLLAAHGGFDFAGTFDRFAPLLVAGGWRVVGWDQRGHGDSDHAPLYSFLADVRDALAVLDSTTDGPVPVLGHSKGGSLIMQLAEAVPHRVTKLVNLDGIPSGRRAPDVADRERTRLLAEELSGWLDSRREMGTKVRRPGTIDELAERRRRMNPRLDLDWLRYLVGIGARQDPDGWRWKIDPTLRMGGFGPWRPEWALERLAVLTVPVLGILGHEAEPMGWGTRPEQVTGFLPPATRLEVYTDAGHFVHIEQPERTAEIVLDFLGTAA